MEELTSVFACLAAIGLALCVIALGAAQWPSTPVIDHPRPQIELRPASSKARQARAIEPEHKSKRSNIQVTRQLRQSPRLSEEAANAHAEEPPARAWSPMDFH